MHCVINMLSVSRAYFLLHQFIHRKFVLALPFRAVALASSLKIIKIYYSKVRSSVTD